MLADLTDERMLRVTLFLSGWAPWQYTNTLSTQRIAAVSR